MGAAAVPVAQFFGHPAVRVGLMALAGLAAVGHVAEISKNDVGEKKFEKDDTPCCCEYKKGEHSRPLFYQHFIFKSSRKEAKEAALHYPHARGVMHHAHNSKEKYPHFHPTIDPAGKVKIPGVHFQYPR